LLAAIAIACFSLFAPAEIIGKTGSQTRIDLARPEEPMSENKASGTAAQLTARQPEDCDRMLLAALQAGDLDASVALYEPGAALFAKSGEAVIGHEAIRASNAALIALNPTFHIERIVTTVSGDGSIATTRMKARLEGTRPDGRPVKSALHTLEVLRKQPDGSWRYVIDDPFGSMRDQMEPSAPG
jgi:ketosteroid isomerase-like protein